MCPAHCVALTLRVKVPGLMPYSPWRALTPVAHVQMAKVARRVSALEGQRLLLVHATADGEPPTLTTALGESIALRGVTGFDTFLFSSLNRKNPFPAHRRTHHAAH